MIICLQNVFTYCYHPSIFEATRGVSADDGATFPAVLK